jgi:hypothetical protein
VSHQFLLCSVAVGRSYVLDDPQAKRELPPAATGPGAKANGSIAYDSLYLHLPEEQLALAGGAAAAHAATGIDASAGALIEEGGPDSYRHTYVVFDSAQVLPKAIVHFGYHPSERLSRQPVKPIDLDSIKHQVAAALSLLGPSAPAATDKMLSDIGAAYETALAQSNDADPLLEERKRAIRETLRAVDEKLRAVQANSATVEEALYARLQEALGQLQHETQRKLNLLLSEELELRRQLHMIEWTDSFVPVLQQGLPPMSFIAAWERHTSVRSSLYSLIPAAAGVSARVLEEVQPDMRLVGQLEVITERNALAAASMTGMPAQLPQTAAAARFFGMNPATAAASTTTRDSAAFSFASSTAAAAAAAAMDAAPAPPAPATSNASMYAAAAAAGYAQTASRSSMATAAAPVTPPAPTPLQQQQAEAEDPAATLALARANLAAVDAASVHLPPQYRAQSDMARAEAEVRVKEAEAKAKGAATIAAAAAAAPAPAPAAVAPAPAATAAADANALVPAAAQQPSNAAASLAKTMASLGPAASAYITGEERLHRFSIRREAERKRRQLAAAGAPDSVVLVGPSLAFQGSVIITPTDAKELYLTLPEATGDEALAGAPPATTLLYSSTANGGGTLAAFADAFEASGFTGATVILVKANGQTFGGYAADAWDFSGQYGGTTRSFLFSVSKDCKIPYTGRVRGPAQPGDAMLREQHELYQTQLQNQYVAQYNSTAQLLGREPDMDEQGRLIAYQQGENGQIMPVAIPVPRPKPFVRHDALRSTRDLLQFGLRDLSIRGDLAEGSSELEFSYGVGLKAAPQSQESKTFLAGSPIFTIEALEIWAITSRLPQEDEGAQ